MSSIDDTPLDVCGCCAQNPCNCAPAEGTALNRPGLPAIAYRVGTHSSFFQRMVASLSTFELTDEDGTKRRPLAKLTTRAPDDPSIAMMDAFAIVGDVLTFYQERIANEGYLRTATERRSVLELAREIGYELNPGVAASTYLAFTVEDAPSAPKQATVPQGTRIQSVPGPGELPQTFETAAGITAHVEWNALKARQWQPQVLDIEARKLYLDEPLSPTQKNFLLLGEKVEEIFKVTKRIVAHQIFLAGIGLNLKPAEVLLVEVGGKVLPVVVASATEDAINNVTRVDFGASHDLPLVPLPKLKVAKEQDTEGQQIAQTLANVKDFIVDQEWSEQDLQAFLTIQGWDVPTLLTQVASLVEAEQQVGNVYSFAQRLNFFGSTAPRWKSLIPPTSDFNYPQGYPKSWDEPPTTIWRDGITPRRTRTGNDGDLYSNVTTSDVFLEREVTDVRAESWVVFEHPPAQPKPIHLREGAFEEEALFISDQGGAPEFTTVPGGPDRYGVFLATQVTQGSRADFGMSGKSTGLKLAEPVAEIVNNPPEPDRADFDDVPLTTAIRKRNVYTLRGSVAWVQAELMPLAMIPYDVPIQKSATEPTQEVTLGEMVIGLTVGQYLMITGVEAGDDNAASTGVTRNEVAILDGIEHGHGYTTLLFKKPLTYRYLRSSFSINANVALATNGSTVANEVLGSGDGSQINQSFTLHKSPLTYVSAVTPTGAASTLTVWVNGVAWTEVPYLYGQGPRSQSYTIRNADDGTSTIEIGDGQQGARLPSGQENVLATYRTGIGPGGEVGAGSLSLLLNRPLGIRSVVNPLAASGAMAPETLDSARSNAPRTVLTLDRIVSLDDFADFARGFAGIGKAQAEVMWSGHVRVVHLTLAGPAGELVLDDDPVSQNLVAAINEFSDGTDEVRVSTYQPIAFRLSAGVKIDPAYVSADVLADVMSALTSAFAFTVRDLAQPVTDAEIMSLIQSVPGVIYTNVTQLYTGNTPGPEPASVLQASRATFSQALANAHAENPFLGAQLLTVSPGGITLTEI